MSFLVACADPQLAVVACETRFCAGPWPNQHGTASDGAAFRLTNPLGGPRIRVPAAPYRNVRPIGGWHPTRGGWMTGTMQSPCLQLVYAAIQALPATDGDAIARTVRSVAARYRTAATEDPNAPLARGAIFVVSAGPLGLQAVMIRGDGTRGGAGGYNIPPEFSTAADGVAPAFRAAVLEPFEATWLCEPALAPRLRAVGTMFRRCAERCGPDGTVNDQVELAVLRLVVTSGRWRLRYDYLRPTSAEVLEVADPEALLMPCAPTEVACSTS